MSGGLDAGSHAVGFAGLFAPSEVMGRPTHEDPYPIEERTVRADGSHLQCQLEVRPKPYSQTLQSQAVL